MFINFKLNQYKILELLGTFKIHINTVHFLILVKELFLTSSIIKQ